MIPTPHQEFCSRVDTLVSAIINISTVLECYHVLFALVPGTVHKPHPIGVGGVSTINNTLEYTFTSYLQSRTIAKTYLDIIIRGKLPSTEENLDL